jgi:glycolate oxidase FAD binding subunit
VDDSEKTIGSIYATSGAELSDSVLGVQIINGKGELLNFGGQVMKNVAGYDVSRLLVGSLGQLAVITQISFKVLPEEFANRAELKQVQTKTESPIKSEIEKKLKTVFDPYGVFI